MRPDWERLTLVFLAAFVAAHLVIRYGYPESSADPVLVEIHAAESMRDWQRETASLYAEQDPSDGGSSESQNTGIKDSAFRSADAWRTVQQASHDHQRKLAQAGDRYLQQQKREKITGAAPSASWWIAALVAVGAAVPLSLTRNVRRSRSRSNVNDNDHPHRFGPSNFKAAFPGAPTVDSDVTRIDNGPIDVEQVRLLLTPEYFDQPGKLRSRAARSARVLLIVLGLSAAAAFWVVQLSQTGLIRL